MSAARKPCTIGKSAGRSERITSRWKDDNLVSSCLAGEDGNTGIVGVEWQDPAETGRLALLPVFAILRPVSIHKLAKFKFTTAKALLVCAFLVARMAELADATDSKSVAL